MTLTLSPGPTAVAFEFMTQTVILPVVGSGPGGMLTGAPGKFATAEAGRRGQNANEMYQNYMRGENGVNVAAMGGDASRA